MLKPATSKDPNGLVHIQLLHRDVTTQMQTSSHSMKRTAEEPGGACTIDCWSLYEPTYSPSCLQSNAQDLGTEDALKPALNGTTACSVPCLKSLHRLFCALLKSRYEFCSLSSHTTCKCCTSYRSSSNRGTQLEEKKDSSHKHHEPSDKFRGCPGSRNTQNPYIEAQTWMIHQVVCTADMHVWLCFHLMSHALVCSIHLT